MRLVGEGYGYCGGCGGGGGGDMSVEEEPAEYSLGGYIDLKGSPMWPAGW